MMQAIKLLSLTPWVRPAGPEGMAFYFTWMRLSSIRQLDW